MNRTVRCALFLAVSLSVLGMTSILFLSGRRTPPSVGIVGTWRGDTTKTFREIYSDYGMTARDARTVVTFRADGTYVSEDSAILIGATRARKGVRVKYSGVSAGKFSFNAGAGTLREVVGERSIDGRPLIVDLPQSVSLRLQGSTLLVAEDYGQGKRFECRLRRQP